MYTKPHRFQRKHSHSKALYQNQKAHAHTPNQRPKLMRLYYSKTYITKKPKTKSRSQRKGLSHDKGHKAQYNIVCSMYVRKCVSLSVCVCVCVYTHTHVHMHVCIFVCVCVCVYENQITMTHSSHLKGLSHEKARTAKLSLDTKDSVTKMIEPS